MQLTFVVISIVSIIINVILCVLISYKKKKAFNDHESLSILSDLLRARKVLVEIRRVDPGEVFLRSPKDIR